MKKWGFSTVLWILAFAAMGCATTKEQNTGENLIRHSLGYNLRSQNEKDRENPDERPEWFGGEPDFKPNLWYKWQAEKEKDGINRYFLGMSVRGETKILRETDSVDWSDEKVIKQAVGNALNQLNHAAITQISTHYKERTQEVRKQRGTEQGGVTVEELSQYQSEEEISLQTEAESVGRFEGIELKSFTMTYEQPSRKELTRCWTVLKISQANIDKAVAEIRKEQEASLSAEDKKKNREARQEKTFNDLSFRHKKVSEQFNRSEVFSDERKSAALYVELNQIYAELDRLSIMKDRDDDQGRNYRELINQVETNISIYNPSERMQKRLEDLENQIVVKDALIEELQKGRLVSQTFIMPFPQRPNETKVSNSTVNIFAASNTISNREYIAFTAAAGINSQSRAEKGLNAAATSISWNDAALYCNFLSNFYGLAPCYTESNRQISGYDDRKNGYRLPHQAEIIAMLEAEPGFIDKQEFSQIGIWSSDTGDSSEHIVYKLSDGRLIPLMYQSIMDTMPDMEIGLRVVRNAE